jgi:hypothetical protein
VLDLNGSYVSTSLGSSWGFGPLGQIGLSAFDTIELGEFHYTQELSTLSATGVSVLPTDDLHIGYSRLVPLSYVAALNYDYRIHSQSGLPAEHWVDGAVTLYVTDRIRWFGGFRWVSGAPQWDGRLIRTGLSASISDSFEVTGTVYDSAQATFNNYQDLYSWVVDVAYHGPRNSLVVAGFGTSPLINNLDLHARAIVPVTDRMAVQLGIGHNSTNADTRATVGLRFTW